jgi:hypothetical protein
MFITKIRRLLLSASGEEVLTVNCFYRLGDWMAVYTSIPLHQELWVMDHKKVIKS